LAPRSDDLSVSFEDIQRIQSLMDDTQFVCSKEYEELTKNVQNNFALRMVFQLVGIPTSDTFKEQRCGKGPRKPLVDNIVQESLDHPERGPEEQEQEQKEPKIPTTEPTNAQVEAAIQKVNGPSEPESPSEPQASLSPQASLPPQDPTETSQVPSVIQKQPSIEAPSETSLPPSLPPQEPSVKKVPSTISRRGGRSLRRAL